MTDTSVAITGIPSTIARADYLRMLESVGLDPMRLRSATFGRNDIRAEVFAEDPALVAEGKTFPATAVIGDHELLCHEIVIPVVD